jgi:hypothetical protein
MRNLPCELVLIITGFFDTSGVHKFLVEYWKCSLLSSFVRQQLMKRILADSDDELILKLVEYNKFAPSHPIIQKIFPPYSVNGILSTYIEKNIVKLYCRINSTNNRCISIQVKYKDHRITFRPRALQFTHNGKPVDAAFTHSYNDTSRGPEHGSIKCNTKLWETLKKYCDTHLNYSSIIMNIISPINNADNRKFIKLTNVYVDSLINYY